jgi:hypothetical protein
MKIHVQGLGGPDLAFYDSLEGRVMIQIVRMRILVAVQAIDFQNGIDVWPASGTSGRCFFRLFVRFRNRRRTA